MIESAYHKWLLKRRVYCDLCSSISPATRVIDIPFNEHWPEKNKTIVVCDAHYRAYTPIETGLSEQSKHEKENNERWLQGRKNYND